MSSFAGLKNKQAAWRAAGLCHSCGAEAAEDRKLCEEHLRYQRQRKREVRAERKRAGLCSCGSAPHPGSKCVRVSRPVDAAARDIRERNFARADKMRRRELEKRRGAGLCMTRRCPNKATVGDLCGYHADPREVKKRRAAQVLAQQRDARANGLCTSCLRPNLTRPGTCYCQRCADLKAARGNEARAEWRAAGRCSGCGKRRGPRWSMCARCRKAARLLKRRKSRERYQAGICGACSRPRVEGRVLCEVHDARVAEHRARRKLVAAGLVIKERRAA